MSGKISLTENEVNTHQSIQSKLASVKVEDISDESDSLPGPDLEFPNTMA